jgi:type I site-specific restriction-modification system R (restriction) subunit
MDGNWKSEYTRWYRLLESIFGGYVPRLDDDEIIGYISEKDWIIVPVQGEIDKEDARSSPRPSLWFSLSSKDLISFGIIFDKLGSVERLRNIVAPYNDHEREELINKLSVLDNKFKTRVLRKTKVYYWREGPLYETVFEREANHMDYVQFTKAFEFVDKILDERNLLDGREKFKLAPAVELAAGEVERKEVAFIDALSEIKSIYEFAVSVRTESEYQKEKEAKEDAERIEKQKAYSKFIEELNQKRKNGEISAEDWRRLNAEYSKMHPE